MIKNDFSKFKVLGITILVTVTACVGGSLDVSAETLRSYGIEFELILNDRNQVNYKFKKNKLSIDKLNKIYKLIKAGRNTISISKYLVSYSFEPSAFITYYLLHDPLINHVIANGNTIYSDLYHNHNFHLRAGPLSL